MLHLLLILTAARSPDAPPELAPIVRMVEDGSLAHLTETVARLGAFVDSAETPREALRKLDLISADPRWLKFLDAMFDLVRAVEGHGELLRAVEDVAPSMFGNDDLGRQAAVAMSNVLKMVDTESPEFAALTSVESRRNILLHRRLLAESPHATAELRAELRIALRGEVALLLLGLPDPTHRGVYLQAFTAGAQASLRMANDPEALSAAAVGAFEEASLPPTRDVREASARAMRRYSQVLTRLA